MQSNGNTLPLHLMGDHQVASDISLPTKPELFERVLTREQLIAIHTAVGREQLEQLASVAHGTEPNPDYEALAVQEGQDLEILFRAIRQVTGKSQPWIIGFASDFAKGLMEYIDRQ